jgi:hypothetical protein
MPSGKRFVALTARVAAGAEGVTLQQRQRARLLGRVGEVHVVLNFLEALRGRRAR